MRLPTVGIRAFTRLSLASTFGLGLLIVSGGLVRLTDSGLGCPDWPSCARTSFVGPLSFHKDVEFGNRLLSVVVTVLVVATVLAAFRLSPRRRDLRAPAVGLAGGIVAQIVLGGLVVLYHLWPPLVMAHFLASEAIVVVAVVLWWRCRQIEAPTVALVSPRFVLLSRTLVATAMTVVAVGTAVSGAGPHGGSQGVRRLPVGFRAVTEVHATMAAFLVGLIVATVFATWIGEAPAGVTRRAQVLLAVAVAQAGVGYTQYLLKVPALLVAVHLAGATAVVASAARFHLGLFVRPLPGGDSRPPGGEDAGARRPVNVPGEAQSVL